MFDVGPILKLPSILTVSMRCEGQQRAVRSHGPCSDYRGTGLLMCLRVVVHMEVVVGKERMRLLREVSMGDET